MITEDAPDPRDVFWSNAGVDLVNMEKRKILVQLVLLSGIIGWSYFVSFVQKIVKASVEEITTEGDIINLVKDGELIRFENFSIPN